jgi:hypothetical protein
MVLTSDIDTLFNSVFKKSAESHFLNFQAIHSIVLSDW